MILLIWGFIICASRVPGNHIRMSYLPPEIPMDDDGFRPQDADYRNFIDHRLHELLTEDDLSFHTIRGSVEERVGQIAGLCQAGCV
ncbi:MAG: hypothetical protein DRI57_17505 [Deltaproteobacteria bacterium]|nr:MAG: hypothetical protein DRI57_17505 [Deltaproteobacteria bacterium]